VERRRRDERGRKDDAARMFIGAVGGPRAQPTGDSAGESASVYAVTITGHIHESRRVSDWPIASSFVDVVKFPPFTSRIRWRRAAIAAAAADENAVWNIHFLLSLKYRGRAWPGVRYKSLHSLSLSPLSISTLLLFAASACFPVRREHRNCVKSIKLTFTNFFTSIRQNSF